MFIYGIKKIPQLFHKKLMFRRRFLKVCIVCLLSCV